MTHGVAFVLQDLLRASSVYLPRHCSTSSAPLSRVCGGPAGAGFERIAEARSLSARRLAMATAVLGLFAHAVRFDQMTSAAILWLSQRPHGRIEQLSDWIGFSNRQLRRRFNAAAAMVRRCFSLCCASSVYSISQTTRMRPATSLDCLRTQAMPTKHI